jgi:putative GTP pyrophosphokinase
VDIEELRREYDSIAPRAERLKAHLCEQVTKILSEKQVTLGVPLESRVKSWDSLTEKLNRRSLTINRIVELQDLVGLRIILLFLRDLGPMGDLLAKTFDLVSKEDTSMRLRETQFGYQSLHFIVRLPKAWLEVPTLTDLGDLTAELQIRTLSQHIWAASGVTPFQWTGLGLCLG